jgi:hypothetical protein
VERLLEWWDRQVILSMLNRRDRKISKAELLAQIERLIIEHSNRGLPDDVAGRLGDERDKADVTAAVRALKRKRLPHPRHQLGPRNPGGVVRAGLFMSVAAAFRGMSAVRVPAGRGIPLLADVADGERRDGRPQRVVRREDAVIAVNLLHIDDPVALLREAFRVLPARGGRLRPGFPSSPGRRG